MKTYIYVPEHMNASDFYEKAYSIGASQIIQGQSDIIEEYVNDPNNFLIIEIPENKGLTIEKFVFSENSEINIFYIDEWINNNQYDLYGILYKLDIDNPSIQYKIKEIKFNREGDYSFKTSIVINDYGEYILKIINKFTKLSIDECELIIYKEFDGK